MSDTIFITGVVIHARHGVMDHETEVGQRFVIDLELAIDLSQSSRSDRLADTVSANRSEREDCDKSIASSRSITKRCPTSVSWSITPWRA